jgi:Zn-dependent peptidase ImmA (M78 family)/DNA-binding XRE family transcriptional regulator
VRIGTSGFVGERLVEAREARGMSAVTLSELIGISAVTISQYEHGRSTPSPEIMDRIIGKLELPRAFFLRPLAPGYDDPIFYRSLASASKATRIKMRRRLGWLREIAAYLREYLELPKVNFPTLTLPEDITSLSDEYIDDIALECRRIWGLGDGPLADITLLLENCGAIITRGATDSPAMDAFSRWEPVDQTPYIFLGSDKESAVRSRLDAAHELGHIVLHRHLSSRQVGNLAIHRQLERQAFRFGSAFLLPAVSYTSELWAPTLDAFLSLKDRWRVAIGAQLKRCAELGIITDEQERRMWINYRRRGYPPEPLDDRIPIERPRLLRRSVELLVESGTRARGQILLDLPFARQDIESLAGLPDGYLGSDFGEVAAMPKLRPSEGRLTGSGGGTILPFSRNRDE